MLTTTPTKAVPLLPAQWPRLPQTRGLLGGEEVEALPAAEAAADEGLGDEAVHEGVRGRAVTGRRLQRLTA
jgi:hypothetical protein